LDLKTEKILDCGPARKGIQSSDVPLALHFGSPFIQNFPAAHTAEMRQQVVRPQMLLKLIAQASDHFSPVHHNQTVSQVCGLEHGVGNINHVSSLEQKASAEKPAC